ncbi:alpha/beta hydrolase [Pseudonocardiaceae bacterium YIM PH 21723]|nr:alpha/beta hydrolase [Pseudonocardiaceae bacterium YIM PH 21723]
MPKHSKPSRQSVWLAFLFRTLIKPFVFWFRPGLSINRLRHTGLLLDRSLGLLPVGKRPVPGVSVEPLTVHGCRAEWLRPETESGGVLLYLHGGGFFFGGPHTHRRLVSRLARSSGLAALSLEYRQLPLSGLGDSIADCVAAYRLLLDQGFAADRIVIGGDSAGGHLALATSLAAVQSGLPKPAGVYVVAVGESG